MKRQLSPWSKMRANHLTTYPECRICGARDDLHVHHLRYRGRRGCSEIPGDLVTLCEDHHNDLHRVLGRTPALSAQLTYIEQATFVRAL